MKRNFSAFAAKAAAETGEPVVEIERVDAKGVLTPLDAALLTGADTLVVISFDSMTSGQEARPDEIAALGAFLADPDHLAFVCPHHEIGYAPDMPHAAMLEAQLADFLHHGDKTIPPRQVFGGFARSLLAGLGLPVENRFGLRPAAEPDGSPAPIERVDAADRLGLLDGVATLNVHPHLPHFERLGPAAERLDVLARQRIDLSAPPHPFTRDGRDRFDALLISRPEVFAGCLVISDATHWSSTAGGVESLSRMWHNVVGRPRPGGGDGAR